MTAEFYLTQIVSHHSRPAVEGFLGEAAGAGSRCQGCLACSITARPTRAPSDAQRLPTGAGPHLTEEFSAGASAEDVCARSIRELGAAGVRHFYVSNLPLGRAAATLQRILDRV